MENGKTYTQTWTIMGDCQRTSSFTCEGFAKNGSARGVYVDADGKRYAKTFVKPSRFADWQAK